MPDQFMITSRAQPAPTLRNIIAPLVVAADLMLASTAVAQTMPPTQQNKLAVEASFEAWSAGTGSPYDLLDPECSWTIEGHSLAGGTYPSREAFMREVIRPFNARMLVPLRPGKRRFYADGDTVIVYFDAHGVARGGRPYDNSYAWILQMLDGRIIEANAFFDAVKFDELWVRVKPARD